MGATCTVQTYRNSCKFFSESDKKKKKKKKLAKVISKIQVSYPGPSWPSCSVEVTLCKTLQSPSLVLVKPRKNNNVSCCRDMAEIL